MANPEHLDLARQGREAWNRWRRRHPGVAADFAGADFTRPENAKISFAGFELGARANFARCAFGGADHRAVAERGISPYAPEIAPFLAGGAWFYGARFGDAADFTDATFRGVALFQAAEFGAGASFARAAFLDEANFVGAVFADGADFAEAAFAKLAQFERARFRGAVSFAAGAAAGAVQSLPHLVFRHARFVGPACFAQRRFLDRADFAYAAFGVPPDFGGVTGRAGIDFHGARFALREGLLPGWTTSTQTLAAIRTLRRVARDAGAADAERDLLVLERKAERGVAWKNALAAPWSEPLAKLALAGRAAARTAAVTLYALASDCGRSFVRPALWLVLVNVAAYFAYRAYAKPSTTMAGRAARGTWGWMKSLFVTPPPSAATTSSALSSDQQKALFEFWWSGAVPGSVTRAAYDKATLALFGAEGIPPLVYAAQFGHTALNAVLVLLLALALRDQFRVPPSP